MAGDALIYGDTRKLVALAKRIEKLGNRSFQKQLNVGLASEARQLVMEGFERGRDPYGKAWKKPRGRKGGRPLRDTDRLMSSIVARPSANGFTVGSKLTYARIHNRGGVIKAKGGGYLKFKVGGPRGGKSQRRGGKLGKGEHWVQVKQVTIPKRQFLPSGERLGRKWSSAFNELARFLRRQWLGR
jgi:phage gpG-like protein